MPTANVEVLRKRLVRIYDLAMAADSEQHFFLWLYDYVRVFDQEENLGGMFKAIQEQKLAEYKEVNELWQKAVDEIQKIYKQVASHVKYSGITDKVVTKNLAEFRDVVEGRMTSSRGYVEDLYDKLSYALMTMVEDGNEAELKFVQRYGEVSNERRITSWTFSPSYTKYDQIMTGLKIIEITRLWFSWDKIVTAFWAIDDVKWKIHDDFAKKNKFFELMGWSSMQAEMRKIIKGEQFGPSEQAHEFKSVDYRYYIAKVHQFTLEYLELEPDTHSSITPVTPTGGIDLIIGVHWSLKKDENFVYLRINGKDYRFKRDLDNAGILLAALDDDPEGNVVFEDIKGSMVDVVDVGKVKNPGRVPYDAARALVSRIAGDLGVVRFLTYNMHSASFNHDYLGGRESLDSSVAVVDQ